MPKKAKEVELNAEQLNTLRDWHSYKEALDVAKEKEFALRQTIVNTCGFDPTKFEGSETVNIGNGWKLKALKVQSYKVCNDNGEAIKVQNLIGSATGANRPDLAVRLINYKPELSVTTYKEIQPIIDSVEGLKEALAAAITIKPGSPQLELIAPEKAEAKTA